MAGDFKNSDRAELPETRSVSASLRFLAFKLAGNFDTARTFVDPARTYFHSQIIIMNVVRLTDNRIATLEALARFYFLVPKQLLRLGYNHRPLESLQASSSAIDRAFACPDPMC